MEKQDLQQQFQKYLNGECSASEAEQLLRYIQSGVDREYIEQLIADNLDNPIAEELANDLEIQHRLDQSHNYLQHKIQETKVRRLPVRTIVMAGIAASFLLFVFSGWFFRDQIDSMLHPMQLLSTLKGERKQLTLADGTVIWLSPASSLKYPSKFNHATREVQLTGSAFFEVAKDKAHPFIVHTGKVDTRVLGTSFQVKAYQEEPDIQVTLLTGKVLLKDGNDTIHLVPNQQGTVTKKTGKIKKIAYPDASRFLDERNGLFEYHGEPAMQVVADLQREFNVNIMINGSLNDRGFYGGFSTAEGIDKALVKLCATIGAKCTLRDGAYTISPRDSNTN